MYSLLGEGPEEETMQRLGAVVGIQKLHLMLSQEKIKVTRLLLGPEEPSKPLLVQQGIPGVLQLHLEFRQRVGQVVQVVLGVALVVKTRQQNKDSKGPRVALMVLMEVC